MVHMPSLETWEWDLKIFDGAPTLTTHVDHLLSTQYKHRAQTLYCHTIHLLRADNWVCRISVLYPEHVVMYMIIIHIDHVSE